MSYKPTIEEIKKLRTASEAPLKDVKKALAATNGDIPAAFEWLRKKGVASATAKAGRSTAEGLVGAFIQGKSGAIVEVNSETDFVAMNDKFQELVSEVVRSLQVDANTNGEVSKEDMQQLVLSDSLKVEQRVPELIGKVGENVVVKRGAKLSVQNGLISAYLHNTASPGLGRAGAIVGIELDSIMTSTHEEELEKIGKKLAMHIVASKPKYLNRDSVPEDIVAKERDFLMDQVKDSGKPQNILNKMIDGRLNKFYSETTLLDQLHMVEEGNPKIKSLLQTVGKKLGVNITVSAFQRYEIGEETASPKE